MEWGEWRIFCAGRSEVPLVVIGTVNGSPLTPILDLTLLTPMYAFNNLQRSTQIGSVVMVVLFTLPCPSWLKTFLQIGLTIIPASLLKSMGGCCRFFGAFLRNSRVFFCKKNEGKQLLLLKGCFYQSQRFFILTQQLLSKNTGITQWTVSKLTFWNFFQYILVLYSKMMGSTGWMETMLGWTSTFKGII